MTDSTTSEDFAKGQEAERARIAEYLQHFEDRGRRMADEAETDDSRTYQTNMANAVQAMRRAITGQFHWKEEWRDS